MRIFYFILIFLLIGERGFSQNEKRTQRSAVSAQFAGSVGFLSLGYHRVFYNDKLSLGLVYGNTPRRLGGISSISLKLRYNPFHIKVYKSIYFEPIQVGAFLAQNFGEYLRSHWPTRYKHRYYWWGNSFRQHVFLSTQMAAKFKKGLFRKIGGYFEVNTNDLYVYSYLSNRKSLSVYDIVFFGIGMQATIE